MSDEENVFAHLMMKGASSSSSSSATAATNRAVSSSIFWILGLEDLGEDEGGGGIVWVCGGVGV